MAQFILQHQDFFRRGLSLFPQFPRIERFMLFSQPPFALPFFQLFHQQCIRSSQLALSPDDLFSRLVPNELDNGINQRPFLLLCGQTGIFNP